MTFARTTFISGGLGGYQCSYLLCRNKKSPEPLTLSFDFCSRKQYCVNSCKPLSLRWLEYQTMSRRYQLGGSVVSAASLISPPTKSVTHRWNQISPFFRESKALFLPASISVEIFSSHSHFRNNTISKCFLFVAFSYQRFKEWLKVVICKGFFHIPCSLHTLKDGRELESAISTA